MGHPRPQIVRRQGMPVGMIVLIVVGVIVVGIGGLAAMLLPALGRARAEARKVKCSSNLAQMGKAANLYLLKYGGNSMLPVPAESFRGSDWLAVLYWTDILAEPSAFHCPANRTAKNLEPLDTNRDGVLAEYDDYGKWDGSLSADCVEYAARARGRCAGTPTESFEEGGLSYDAAIACDLPGNHDDGINVVYFDSHVDFLPDAGQYVGNALGTGQWERNLRFMDHPKLDEKP
jgi:prepilin-type processing-associated H-X9-DG protein